MLFSSQIKAADDWGDEEKDGEKDFFSTIVVEKVPVKKKVVSPWSFGGFVEEEVVYSLRFDQDKLRHLRTSWENTISRKLGEQWKAVAQTYVRIDALYQWGNMDNYSSEEVDEFKHRFEFGEVYVDGSLNSNFSLKVGRQLVPWGMSDFFQITDRVNPRNETELGLIDLDESRLPVFATRFSYVDNWQFDLVWVYEKRSSRLAPNNGDYDYFALFQEEGIAVNRRETSSAKSEEFFVNIKKNWKYGDTSFTAGQANEDLPYISSASLQNTNLTMHTDYGSNSFAGASGSLIWQRFVFKFEMNYILNRQINRSDINAQLQNGTTVDNLILSEKHDTAAFMLGLDYTTGNEWHITAEFMNERTLAYNQMLSVRKNFRVLSVLANKKWMNDKLGLTLFATHLFNEDGDFLRVNIEYELSKGLHIEIGGINYEVLNKDSVYRPYKDNDRVYSTLKYSY